jgi:predicted outer membrane repeat protein
MMKRHFVFGVALAALVGELGAFGATINVPSDQPTLQDAFDASVDGDTIVVGRGTWAGFSGILGFGVDLTIRSQDPQDPDIVLGTVIAGAFVDGPTGDGLLRIEGVCFGGAVDLSASFATFENCSFTTSGIDCFQAGLTVRNCVFTNCSLPAGGVGGGGAIQVAPSADSFLVLEDSAFYNNSSTASGGAVSTAFIDVSIERCIFSGNTSGGSGGAVYAEEGNRVEISNSTFCGNTAESSGGAINAFGYELLLEECVITANRAGGTGGGAVLTSVDSGQLRRCVVQGNTAGGSGGGVAVGGPAPLIATGGITTVCGNLPDQSTGALSGILRIGMHCPPPSQGEACIGDLDGNGSVGFSDLIIVLNNWGAC